MPKVIKYVQTFGVQQVTPDCRPYMQQRQLYIPSTNAEIVTELEVTKENFALTPAEFEAIKLWELGQGDAPKLKNLRYTPLGWSRIMAQLESPYQEGESDLDVWADDDDEEFEDQYKKE